ncbi:MAG: hypothetical protein HOE90_01580 [Bacteriovoracaceae bacterium]|nr:hypothetical protein [Bacteriovoracaceae bacterium]
MSGVGQRFVDAGYSDLKPLIKIDGKCIIEHVIDLFPGETNFIFICNETHLKTTPIERILKEKMPSGKIVPISPHKKGPVFAVSQVFDLIDDSEEVIVNYCDFGTYWDYDDFLKHTRDRDADGAVVSYRNFHPHMLGSTNYAFMRDDKQWMLEIKEKEPFTDDRMNEFASNGTYYFKSGELVKKYFVELMEKGIGVKGEFYVSMIYNLLVQDDLKVSIYKIQHMLQWGTPQDVEEYGNWSRYFRDVLTHTDIESKLPGRNTTVIPMAGRGSRFAVENYTDPKPLIDVSGYPMIVQALNYLPKTDDYQFLCLGEHLDQYPLQKTLEERYSNCKIIRVDEVTQGQACTCELAIKDIDSDTSVLIGACDNGMLWNTKKMESLVSDEGVDAICFTFRNHPSSSQNPQMYGWVKTSGETITGVSVKVPISDKPENDHAIVGAFWFRRARDFMACLNDLYKNNERVNTEFYVDSLMGVIAKMGKNAKVMEVDDYICWGTPNDLKSYQYWQSFFHKADFHPYDIEKDPYANPQKVEALKEEFGTFSQENR